VTNRHQLRFFRRKSTATNNQIELFDFDADDFLRCLDLRAEGSFLDRPISIA